MRRLVRAAGGAVLVSLALVLSLPGVRVVRADDAASQPEKGAMCRAEAPLAPPAVVDQVAQDIEARAATPEGTPEIPVLNGRGYSYRPAGRQVDLSALAREVALRKRQQRQER